MRTLAAAAVIVIALSAWLTWWILVGVTAIYGAAWLSCVDLDTAADRDNDWADWQEQQRARQYAAFVDTHETN